jgi:hypothetical protein
MLFLYEDPMALASLALGKIIKLRHGQMAPPRKSTVVEKRIKLNQTV